MIDQDKRVQLEWLYAGISGRSRFSCTTYILILSRKGMGAKIKIFFTKIMAAIIQMRLKGGITNPRVHVTFALSKPL